MGRQKKLLEQKLQNQRQLNEDLRNMKNEYELKIEAIGREIQSKQSELESLAAFKDSEIARAKKSHEKVNKEKEEEVKQLE